jgi:hypothetical protein
VIINLTGDVILTHPYADRDFISVITLDSQPRVTEIYDGRVYREEGSTKHGLMDFETKHETYIRTAIPLGTTGVFRCYHKTDQGHQRQTTFKVHDNIIVVDSLNRNSGVREGFGIDLKWEVDLKPESEKNLWTHLLDD